MRLVASYTKDCDAFLPVSASPKSKIVASCAALTAACPLLFGSASASLHPPQTALGSGAVAPLVVAVGIDFVVGRGLADELVQLVVLIVYTLVLDGFKYQIAQRIAGIIGQFFGLPAGKYGGSSLFLQTKNARSFTEQAFFVW